MFHFHKWTKWSKGKRIQVATFVYHGIVLRQQRRCVKCMLSEFHDAPIALYHNDDNRPRGRRVEDY